MPINVEEIKKLPDSEKLQLVDEILDSIDNTAIKRHLLEEENETDRILKERWEEYQSGKMKFDTWENVYKRLIDKAKKRQQKKGDEL